MYLIILAHVIKSMDSDVNNDNMPMMDITELHSISDMQDYGQQSSSRFSCKEI